MSFFSFSDYPKPLEDYEVAIVVADFNEEITEQLLDSTFKALKKCGISPDNINVSHVPGAFEIPFAVKILQLTGNYDGIITLGAIIRGETPHFDYIAAECARGVMERNLSCEVPVIFGVLTCDTKEQAVARLPKGADFAVALVNQMNFVATELRNAGEE